VFAARAIQGRRPAGARRDIGALRVTLLREVPDPVVTGLFRLAVSDAERSPEVARALDEGGGKTTREALVAFLGRAAGTRLIGDANPETIAAQVLALLWGDCQISLLMRLADAPAPAQIEHRARAAASAVLPFILRVRTDANQGRSEFWVATQFDNLIQYRILVCFARSSGRVQVPPETHRSNILDRRQSGRDMPRLGSSQFDPQGTRP
jgi:hypothetical protein